MMITRYLQHLCLASAALLGATCISNSANAQSFTLTSSTFKDGKMLRAKNAGNSNPNCTGQNVSPPLAWKNVPEGTKSFAILVYDPDGKQGLGVVHWIAYGIPASVTSFAEGEVSAQSSKFVGGKSTSQLPTYSGPCPPPKTGLHHYTFTLIATDLEPTELKPGMTRDELFAALNGHAKGGASIVGLWGKP